MTPVCLCRPLQHDLTSNPEAEFRIRMPCLIGRYEPITLFTAILTPPEAMKLVGTSVKLSIQSQQVYRISLIHDIFIIAREKIRERFSAQPSISNFGWV